MAACNSTAICWFATACLTALPLAAHAQGLPVIDNAALQASIANERQTVAQLLQEFAEIVLVYQSLSGTQSVLGVAPGLLSQAEQLPGSPAGQLPGLAYGSSLSGYGQQFYTQNHVYTPTGTDFEALEMRRREVSTANLQGEAQIGAQIAGLRVNDLMALAQNIETIGTAQGAALAAARIGQEQTVLANEQTNVQRLQLQAAEQGRVDAEREEQHGRQDAEQWLADERAAANLGD